VEEAGGRSKVKHLATLLVSTDLSTVVVLLPTPVTMNQVLECIEMTSARVKKEFNLLDYFEHNYGSVKNWQTFVTTLAPQISAAQEARLSIFDKSNLN
jgi:hypothetical protein